jgi:hypothetical protein
MATSSRKSPQMEESINNFTRSLFGRTRTDTIHSNVCVVCNRDASKFKDALSEKEYTISGMCQVCQDKIFG